jgi:hypothetical protein
MQNDDDVIRYLMREMDPSEEVLMERAMMEDDDLLIEVECMRQTLHRLDELPEKTPPVTLSESIIQQAGEHKKKFTLIPGDIFKYAAVLIIGIGLGGGIWLFLQTWVLQKQGKGSPKTVISVHTIKTQPTASDDINIKPWVDRHNVIYFQDKFGRESRYNNIRQTSLHKLTPVHNPSSPTVPYTQTIHLTGASQ